MRRFYRDAPKTVTGASIKQLTLRNFGNTATVSIRGPAQHAVRARVHSEAERGGGNYGSATTPCHVVAQIVHLICHVC